MQQLQSQNPKGNPVPQKNTEKKLPPHVIYVDDINIFSGNIWSNFTGINSAVKELVKKLERIKELNSQGFNTGNGSFSLDGKRFYFSQCANGVAFV